MPRFYFDTDDGTGLFRDQDGDELPDFEAARCLALKCLSDVASDKLANGGDRRDLTVDVRDCTGRLIYTANLALLARRFE